MATDSDRILAAGHPVTFLDGKTYNVRFSMRSLKRIEDEFGSIPGVVELMRDKNLLFGPVSQLLSIGLIAEGFTADQILDLADPKQINEYAAAAFDALAEALPAPALAAPEPEAEADPTPVAEATNGSSPGQASTTSSQFVSVAQMTPSGA